LSIFADEPDDKKVITVVAPHPDDEVFGCGGTIAKCVASGHEVHVIIVTKGDSLFDADLIEQGRGEALKAHELLGVARTHFVDLPAIKLDTLPQYQINDVLTKLFAEIEPDVLFLPFPGDVSSDHRLVHACAMVAARPIVHQVRAIYSYETLSSTNWNSPGLVPAFIPNAFTDISDTIGLKLQAVRIYESQIRQYPHERSPESVEALSRYRGGFVNLPHAEAFVCVRELLFPKPR
jgi:LmbE family N-acetylglucosaminyl deacetylase